MNVEFMKGKQITNSNHKIYIQASLMYIGTCKHGMASVPGIDPSR